MQALTQRQERPHRSGRDGFHPVPSIVGCSEKRSGTRWNSSLPEREGCRTAFTLIELVVVIVLLGVGALLLLPALARTQPNSKAIRCQNNLRQLTVAWRYYAEDNRDILVAPAPEGVMPSRPAWVTNVEDVPPAQFNPLKEITTSPLWPYCGNKVALFKCPADPTQMFYAGTVRPRVRSYSMSHVFGKGEWLTGSGDPNQTTWRTYSRAGDIALPAKTFLFLDEHPESLGDGSFANACTGNQPGDSPASAKIVDYPAGLHGGGCGFAFADGHAEIHKWQSAKLRGPVTYSGTLPLNVPAGEAWQDMRWLAGNTTVRR